MCQTETGFETLIPEQWKVRAQGVRSIEHRVTNDRMGRHVTLKVEPVDPHEVRSGLGNCRGRAFHVLDETEFTKARPWIFRQDIQTRYS